MEDFLKPATLEEIRLLFIGLPPQVCRHFPDSECPRCRSIEQIEELQRKVGKDAMPPKPGERRG